ncbi:uncharacterized protein PFL1_05427 [Pseudozyma flocculosa PF-1]|uniref:Uncharacterized protein n=2 Tax=Pseudozyma flocculosa TaxID=84751 RepID=A0A5C3FC89_9BASI|nr:uncharacterized protein PFL1_05427 [Pseudozyma flocculosa PF-1]EPQ27146.1 hypothetical protein PFL1_05427 [Pseudozyma flocculosa PF-1]SPO41275.1 uncharacterized protein PSFLO_06757 [Pseudozyma flocculosa]
MKLLAISSLLLLAATTGARAEAYTLAIKSHDGQIGHLIYDYDDQTVGFYYISEVAPDPSSQDWDLYVDEDSKVDVVSGRYNKPVDADDPKWPRVLTDVLRELVDGRPYSNLRIKLQSEGEYEDYPISGVFSQLSAASNT